VRWYCEIARVIVSERVQINYIIDNRPLNLALSSLAWACCWAEGKLEASVFMLSGSIDWLGLGCKTVGIRL